MTTLIIALTGIKLKIDRRRGKFDDAPFYGGQQLQTILRSHARAFSIA